MKLPQRTILDLLLGAVLIAAGAGFCRIESEGKEVLLYWLLAGALIGAGFFAPLKNIFLGAVLGLIVSSFFVATVISRLAGCCG